MKISKILQKVAKRDGKHSPVSRTIVKYKNSKEFSYLIDASKS
jgi:hypothetical protein